MSVGKTEIAAIDGGSKTLNHSQLERLGAGLNGGLLLPADRGWPEAIGVWNGMVAKRPAVVVQPESAADVAAAVSFARNEGLLLSIKGGGHNIAGTALAEAGMTLDMSSMRWVSVDPEARTAFVGPGARLGDVDAATQEHGLATVLGALERSSPLSHALVFHLAGALNEHRGDDGAVDNRDAKFITGFSGTWPPDAPAEPHIAWVRTSWERICSYSTGGNYVNFQQADDDTDRLQAGYRDNFQRLRSIKAKYDPDNLFRVNRNISPAA